MAKQPNPPPPPLRPAPRLKSYRLEQRASLAWTVVEVMTEGERVVSVRDAFQPDIRPIAESRLQDLMLANARTL